ncbi:MAG: hypothetical protein E6J42_09175 [Chloroflexi bacterium]|nr:MAG: hypothetical protein E6J42_09175 [Chloroflexota bacterium]
MSSAFKQPGRHFDLASALKVCPQCLGDLVARSDWSGDYYFCVQCHIRAGDGHLRRRLTNALLPADPVAGATLSARRTPLMN